jgi:epoxyqueuosine reductase
MQNPADNDIKKKLQSLAVEHGFIAVGVARARRLAEHENNLKTWLNKGFAGEMQYMHNHLEKRLDPTILVPGAKTVITFLYNYFPSGKQNSSAPKVARYAWGEDYHRVVKDKLFLLVQELEAHGGKLSGRIFVDSAPVMERQWAALAGLGWIGKNSLLLRKGVGSWFFIATLISDIDLPEDQPTTDHCGTCTACMDACPTQAIVSEGVIDARRCISYTTIELKDKTPAEIKANSEGWIFGCDICQEVCPWNSFSVAHSEPRFTPMDNWIEWDRSTWKSLSSEQFNNTFGSSPLTRAGFEKIKGEIE